MTSTHSAPAPLADAVPHPDEHEHEHEHEHEREHDAAQAARGKAWRTVDRTMVLVVLSGVCLAAGMLAEAAGWSQPLTLALFGLAMAAGAVQIVPAGLRGVVRERSLDINFLVTVAVAGAVVLGQWGEGATVVFLFSLGELLEEITLARTRRSIQALMAMAPETAQVRQADASERTVRVEDVPAGSVVLVRPGDRVPLDGVVVHGASAVDQAPITGESVPADKTEGDAVFAGTINGQGYLEVRTTRPFSENTLARIIHLVEEAQSEKAPSQRFVEKFARVYTPLVVVCAVLLMAVPPLVFGEPLAPWFNRALVLLLVACPCALVVSTPVTVVAAIGNASRHGVLIKGGAYLEHAGRLRAVAFDKTGTLTRGVPEVQRVVALSSDTERELLQLAAAAEHRSEHPLARAIVRAARRQGLADLPVVESFEAATGSGVRARVAGRNVLAGRAAWVEAAGVPLGSVHVALEELAAAGQTPVVVAVEGQPAGVIALADALRPAAREAVAALRRTGVRRVVLVSGDTDATAQAIARQVGIAPEDVYAGLLPEDKVAAVRRLVEEQGAAAMVGDGVNDAPALAVATVGIAMGVAGSDAALDTADVALVADDLTRLPWVLELSRRAARTIRFNVGFAIVTKLVVLALGAFGYANLWLAIAADTGASIVVILNGMRLLGRVPLPAAADPARLRQRFGLGEEDEHHGHAH